MYVWACMQHVWVCPAHMLVSVCVPLIPSCGQQRHAAPASRSAPFSVSIPHLPSWSAEPSLYPGFWHLSLFPLLGICISTDATGTSKPQEPWSWGRMAGDEACPLPASLPTGPAQLGFFLVLLLTPPLWREVHATGSHRKMTDLGWGIPTGLGNKKSAFSPSCACWKSLFPLYSSLPPPLLLFFVPPLLPLHSEAFSKQENGDLCEWGRRSNLMFSPRDQACAHL